MEMENYLQRFDIKFYIHNTSNILSTPTLFYFFHSYSRYDHHRQHRAIAFGLPLGTGGVPRNTLNLRKLPLFGAQRTHALCLEPPLDAVQMEHMPAVGESD